MVASVEERFWSSVRKGSGCWSWTASRTRGGYGAFRENGRQVGAHRFSWKMANGPIPAGRWVLHKCDNPPCVNPEHLFLGDASVNAKDAFAKGRRHVPYYDKNGAGNPAAKVTADEVHAIRRLYVDGLTQVELAGLFGLKSSTSVSNIIHGRTWGEAGVTEGRP